MPKVIKKRPAKKKPVQVNEVKSAALHALDKVKERQKLVIVGASAVIVIVFLFILFAWYSASTSRRASTLEQEAYRYYYGETAAEAMSDEEKWKKALELYRQSLEVKGTPSALFYAGNCYYNLKEFDNAIKEYIGFTERYSKDTAILPLVYQKLASAYLKTNQNDKALDTLGKLAKVANGIFKDTALILEARYYEGAGEKEKALEKYREISADFPLSPWSAEVKAKVSDKEAKKAEPSSKNLSEEINAEREEASSRESENVDVTGEQGKEPVPR
jgi:tetratricopeptide (TPR) repeat protein